LKSMHHAKNLPLFPNHLAHEAMTSNNWDLIFNFAREKDL